MATEPPRENVSAACAARHPVGTRFAPILAAQDNCGRAAAPNETTVFGGTIMTLFAELNLDPGGIIAWLLVGLVAGWLAGSVMRGGGFGILGDIVVGLVGALIGGSVRGHATETPPSGTGRSRRRHRRQLCR